MGDLTKQLLQLQARLKIFARMVGAAAIGGGIGMSRSLLIRLYFRSRHRYHGEQMVEVSDAS
jgi:hypothetical protein